MSGVQSAADDEHSPCDSPDVGDLSEGQKPEHGDPQELGVRKRREHRRIGETKPVADASAIGRNRRPEMKNSEDPSRAIPRMTCKPVRRDCNANNGEPGSIAGDMISANTKNLIQAISIEGSVAERYFAVTSDAPRNTVDARISAMPRNGRSARAGAVRAVDFFSGKGNEARSSLAAAAGGGVTVQLG